VTAAPLKKGEAVVVLLDGGPTDFAGVVAVTGSKYVTVELKHGIYRRFPKDGSGRFTLERREQDAVED
jgi:hypothetical protein